MDERDGRVVGLHHVQLAMPEGEEEAAVKFYGYLLGLEQISKPPELAPRGGVWFRGPSIEFHLGVEEGFQPATKAHPAFMVEGLEQLLTRLDMAGIRIVEDEIQLDGFHRVFVRDPFGNRIELIEPVETV
jgi:catechol 2,3-dioxygenase-like lactoylglutathione lyase family enzyme